MMAMDLGQHAGFIWTSYGVSFLVLGGLTLWLLLDARRQVKLLAELEARGVVRRSARKPAKGARKGTR